MIVVGVSGINVYYIFNSLFIIFFILRPVCLGPVHCWTGPVRSGPHLWVRYKYQTRFTLHSDFQFSLVHPCLDWQQPKVFSSGMVSELKVCLRLLISHLFWAHSSKLPHLVLWYHKKLVCVFSGVANNWFVWFSSVTNSWFVFHIWFHKLLFFFHFSSPVDWRQDNN